MVSTDSISTLAGAGPRIDFEAERIAAAVRRHFLGTPRLAVGRYEIGRNLGSGGAGSVYSAFDPVLDREVAVKLLHHTSRRLKQEAAALAMLDHRHVVRVLDYVASSDSQAMVMELVQGVSLRDWLDAGPRSPTDIVQRFVEAGRGLAAVHAHGLVHRDFKPDNVVVDAAGQARLVDFGLVRSYASAMPAPAEGTPHFMAPEQRRGEAPHPAADQYSFCVALHESLQEAAASMPAAIDVALRRGMAADPAARWPSLEALLRRLSPTTQANRRWLIAAGLGVAAVAAWASVAGDPVANPVPVVACPDTLPGSLPAVDMPSDAAWHDAAAGVEAYRRRWPDVRASVCDASPVDPRRVGCLHDAEVHYVVWSELLRDGAVADANLAEQSVGRFPNLEVCVGAAPPEARTTGKDRAAMARLARANFAWTLGDYERAASESEAVWQTLSPEDDCSTRAFAANIHGLAQQRLGAPKVALTWFDRSIYDAMACNDHGTVADSAGRALQIAAHELGQPDALSRYGKMGEAALERAGNPPRRRAIFLSARAITRVQAGEIEGGLTDMREAVALMEAVVGPNSYEMVAHLSNLGATLGMADDPQAASEYLERASSDDSQCPP
ncbi:MAG: serine/threonine-protein kinase, partial [Myxococcota bacterium]